MTTASPADTADPRATDGLPTLAHAFGACRALARARCENFPVLTRLVPPGLRDDFAAVYAFCRLADDLADEHGAGEEDAERALRRLGAWRAKLDACLDGDGAGGRGEETWRVSDGRTPVLPGGEGTGGESGVGAGKEIERCVFRALGETARRRRLPAGPLHDLLDAFEQDQRVRAYRTWEELLGYCRRSANPVGRIVLMLGGHRSPDEDPRPENAERYAMSGAVCTALQLTNHWQDVRRDLEERGRVYLPIEETGLSPEVLADLVRRGEDPGARIAFIKALRPLAARTRELYEQGAGLHRKVAPAIAPAVWMFAAGGRRVLEKIERGGCTTLWSRPRLRGWEKAGLVLRASARARRGR